MTFFESFKNIVLFGCFPWSNLPSSVDGVKMKAIIPPSGGFRQAGMILIYADVGAGAYVTERKEEFINDLIQSLGGVDNELDIREEDIGYIFARDVIKGDWKSTTRLLIFPGGGDLGYCELLNGKGNEQIKSYVSEYGGKYLGFCAGSYYGSGYCKFDLHNWSRNPINGPRELAFFPGIAEGPYLANYDPQSAISSLAPTIKLKPGAFPDFDGIAGIINEYGHSVDNIAEGNPVDSSVLEGGNRTDAKLNLIDSRTSSCNCSSHSLNVYYNGGPVFVGVDAEDSVRNAATESTATANVHVESADVILDNSQIDQITARHSDMDGVTVLAYYEDEDRMSKPSELPYLSAGRASIIEIQKPAWKRAGGKVILSAVHPEISTKYLQCRVNHKDEPPKSRKNLKEKVIPSLLNERYRLLFKGILKRLMRDDSVGRVIGDSRQLPISKS